jgi:AcrR family transcriptional regulator
VVRTRPADRLDQLASAALTVFKRKGFRQALMADVAKEMGVSAGLLYTYVESKEALLYFVLEWLATGEDRAPAASDRALPQRMAQPALKEALSRKRAADPAAELVAIVREHYRAVSDCRDLLTVIDRTAGDIPELRERFFVKARRPLVLRLADYIDLRIAARQFRPVPDSKVAARFVIEAVAWFANHRHGDLDSASIDDEVAEATVVDLLTAALLRHPQAFSGPSRSLSDSPGPQKPRERKGA